jgi:cytochrome b
MAAEERESPRVMVWDAPTRLVHWLIAALIPFSWWSAHNDHLPWHRLSGFTILGLLIFRFIWGWVGASTSRFRGFVAGPARIRAYLGGRLGAYVGHNPLGGWSSLAMLAALSLQVGLGLFSIDEDSLEPGPLAGLVSFDTARAIAHIHHLTFWVVIALVALHLCAIAFYAARGRHLTKAMVTGRAALPPGAQAPKLAPAWRAGLVAAIAAAIACFVAHGLKL